MAREMSEPNAQEPTMEEILASIRRIISEDEPPAEAAAEPEPVAVAAPAPAPAPAPTLVEEEEDDVLELTERAPEPEVLETLGDLDVYVAPEPEPEPEPVAHYEPEPEPAPVYAAAVDNESLVSAPVAASAASSFGQLAHRIAMPKEGRTLEDVVSELLNPLLAAWLDEHLPAIVQAKVEEEVERIARRRMS
jgi:uncharacterized protein